MERITKSIDWRGKTVDVSELLLGEIELLSRQGGNQVDNLVVMLRLSTGLDKKDLETCAPSQIKPIVEAMLEVNQDFFDQARALGMEESAAALENLIRSIFIVGLLPSPEQGSETESGDTPGAGS